MRCSGDRWDERIDLNVPAARRRPPIAFLMISTVLQTCSESLSHGWNEERFIVRGSE